MDYKSFKRHLGKGGLKVGDFARLVGVSANSISNYAKKEEVPQTHALLAVCFGELGDSGLDIREMLSRYGALPNNYFNNPKNSSVIQFDLFKAVNSSADKPTSKMKTSSEKR